MQPFHFLTRKTCIKTLKTKILQLNYCTVFCFVSTVSTILFAIQIIENQNFVPENCYNYCKLYKQAVHTFHQSQWQTNPFFHIPLRCHVLPYCPMTRPVSPDFHAAVAELCSSDWAPGGIHVPSEQSVYVLRALLPASRTDEGRAALGAFPGAINGLASLLTLSRHGDLNTTLSDLGIRVLRNLCARSPTNQARIADCRIHVLVLERITALLDEEDSEINVEQGVCQLPFFGFAVEFLVNFVTCNTDNANAVWTYAFPTLLERLLRCENHAAASAAAALVHNCIAIVPDRMSDLVKIWSGKDGNKSITGTLVQQLRKESEAENGGETFSWSYMIIRRLIGASLVSSCFEALGPTMEVLTTSSRHKFSEDQETLLQFLEASASKTAESAVDDDANAIIFPESSLLFFGTLMEAAFFQKDGTMLRISSSIVGSVILISEDSVTLENLRLSCVKIAVHVLQALKSDKNGMHDGSSHDDETRVVFEGNTPMSGLRGVMIRTIAICCDLCKKAQDSVRKLQGLPFILNALSYESDSSTNPFLREWAILAVRNLTLGNTENAKEISSYELVGMQSDTEFLEKTGLEPFVDPKTGRPRLRVKDGGGD